MSNTIEEHGRVVRRTGSGPEDVTLIDAEFWFRFRVSKPGISEREIWASSENEAYELLDAIKPGRLEALRRRSEEWQRSQESHESQRG